MTQFWAPLGFELLTSYLRSSPNFANQLQRWPISSNAYIPFCLPNCQVSNHMFSQTLLQKPGNAGCTIIRLPKKKNKSLSHSVPEIWQWSGTNVQETKQPFALLNFPLFILACFWCINHLLMVLNRPLMCRIVVSPCISQILLLIWRFPKIWVPHILHPSYNGMFPIFYHPATGCTPIYRNLHI